MKINLPFGKTIIFRFTIFNTPKVFTTGICSRCKDGKHVIFLDYDHQEINEIYNEIKEIQEKYKLSNAFVFALDRPDSYHVIILDKFNATQAMEIMQETNVDPDYIGRIYHKWHEWVLRCEDKGNRKKPVYNSIIPSKYDNHEISTAHKQFLETYYGIPKIIYLKEDYISELKIVHYNTGNRVKK